MLYASLHLWILSGISTGGSVPKLLNRAAAPFGHLLHLSPREGLGVSESPEGLAEQGLPMAWCSATLGAQRLSQPQPA